jgi:hypothetical protein
MQGEPLLVDVRFHALPPLSRPSSSGHQRTWGGTSALCQKRLWWPGRSRWRNVRSQPSAWEAVQPDLSSVGARNAAGESRPRRRRQLQEPG